MTRKAREKRRREKRYGRWDSVGLLRVADRWLLATGCRVVVVIIAVS